MKTKNFTALFLSSFLAFSYAVPQQVLAEDAPQKSREGLPGRRLGGGTRGECSLNTHQLTALVPENNLGVTQAAHPKLFFYLPPTSKPKLVEFILQDEKNNVIYEKTFTTAAAKGIIKINLSDSASTPPALTSGKNYRWFFSIICNPERREHDITVDGWLKRVALDTKTAQLLERATSVDLVNLYANKGLWQDAIATLAELMDKQPNNPQLAATWSQLLRAVKLDAIAQEPILNLKTPVKQSLRLR